MRAWSEQVLVKHPALVAMAAAALVFLSNLGGHAPLDGHEVLVAQTAREMVRTGDWLVPRFSGEVRLQKPPLAYWMTASLYQLFGIDTGITGCFLARLPSALSSVLLTGLIASFVSRRFGQTTGLFAGLIHATSYWTIAYGRLALVDATLVLLVSTAILLAWWDRWLLTEPQRTRPASQPKSSFSRYATCMAPLPLGEVARRAGEGEGRWKVAGRDAPSDSHLIGTTTSDWQEHSPYPSPSGSSGGGDQRGPVARQISCIKRWAQGPRLLQSQTLRRFRLAGRNPVEAKAFWIAIAFWVALGLAVLAKGPVALAFVLPTCVLIRGFRSRQPQDMAWWRSIGHVPGVLLFGGLALAWPIAVACLQPEAARIWYEQSMGRFLSHWGPNTRPMWYYLGMVPLLTLPWTLFWLAAIWPRRAGEDFRATKSFRPACSAADDHRLLWFWFLVGLLFLTVSQGKREHYILPALVPLSMLAGVQLATWSQQWTIVSHARMRLAYAGGVLILGIAAAQWTIVPLVQLRPGLDHMLTRSRQELDRSARVVQIGSNDRSTIFTVDRPMAWPREEAERAEALRSLGTRDLGLVRADHLVWANSVIPLEVIDRVEADEAGLTERNPTSRFLLIRRRYEMVNKP